MAFRRDLQRHLLTIGLLIVLVGLIAASDTLHGKTEAIVVWIENLIAQAPLLGILAFLLLAMLSAMVAFFSSALFAPIGITELPYAVATVYLGDSFLKGESGVFILLGIAAITLAAFVVRIHRRLGR